MRQISRSALAIAVLVSIFFFCANGAKAQSNSAQSIVSKIAEELRNNPVQTKFELKISMPNSTQQHTISGTFLMHKNKFAIETKELDIYFNGTTQWAYMRDVNEVSITNPTKEELSSINPLLLLDSYIDNSYSKMANGNRGNLSYNMIELTPKNKNASFQRAKLKVNKRDNHLLFIQIEEKSGAITTLTLSGMKKVKIPSKNAFEFDSKKYKNIEINDLR